MCITLRCHFSGRIRAMCPFRRMEWLAPLRHGRVVGSERVSLRGEGLAKCSGRGPQSYLKL
jgi:hypothetical protein